MFWQIGPPDLDWLFDDLAQRSRKEDKRIALSAIVSVLLHEKRFDSELPRLRELVAGNESLLKADIALAAIYVAFGGKADMPFCTAHVCFDPKRTLAPLPVCWFKSIR